MFLHILSTVTFISLSSAVELSGSSRAVRINKEAKRSSSLSEENAVILQLEFYISIPRSAKVVAPGKTRIRSICKKEGVIVDNTFTYWLLLGTRAKACQ